MLKPMIDLPFQPITWGGEPHDFTEQTAGGIHGLNLGVYTNETTQRYMLGTRSMTWDGRVFRYGRCGPTGITKTSCAVHNQACLVASRVTGVNTDNVCTVPTAIPGVLKIIFAVAAGTLGDSTSRDQSERTGVVAEDELAGGYIHLQTGDHDQNRGIIGNSALAIDGIAITIYFDAPLDYKLTSGTSTCEILASPYGALAWGNGQWHSFVGMPNVTGTSGQFIWVQTWGPIRISPLTDTTNSREHQFVFDDQGAVTPSHKTVTDTNDYDQQHAGYLIETSSNHAYYCAPFIMLQVNI